MAPTEGGQSSLLSLSVLGVIPARQRCTIHAMWVNKGHVRDVEWAKKLFPKRDTGIFIQQKETHSVEFCLLVSFRNF